MKYMEDTLRFRKKALVLGGYELQKKLSVYQYMSRNID
jgi:hypothetical protein